MRNFRWKRGVETIRTVLAGRPWLRWLIPVLATALVALALLPGLAGLRADRHLGRLQPAELLAKSGPAPAARAPEAEPRRYAAHGDPGARLAPDPLSDDPQAELWSDEPAAEDDLDDYDCIVEPSEMVEIGSPVEGLIESILVERSDWVEADQVIVQLESGVERAQVKLARARSRMVGSVKAREAAFALQQRREDRMGRLYDSDALSLDLRDQVETEAEIARRELEEARDTRQLASLQLEQAVALLRRREIRSPVAGVVVDRLMSPGEVVNEETILIVAQVDPLRVEVILPAALFGTVRPGMRAAVEPELPGDRVYVASVQVVDRVIDAASGTFGVWLELPNAEHEIPGGLNCRVRFLAE